MFFFIFLDFMSHVLQGVEIRAWIIGMAWTDRSSTNVSTIRMGMIVIRGVGVGALFVGRTVVMMTSRQNRHNAVQNLANERVRTSRTHSKTP